MNITISQIQNGFIVAIATPKGQSAVYCATFEEVVKQLQDMASAPNNVSELPRN